MHIDLRRLFTIEKLFEILKDGKWHDLVDLSGQIRAQTGKLTEFSQFTSKLGIIYYDNNAKRIKIEPEWQNLRPDEIEPKVAHNPPSKKPNKVQSTRSAT